MIVRIGRARFLNRPPGVVLPPPPPPPPPDPIPPGTLPPGVRASASTVGYLGSDADLRVVNSAATAPAGCTWQTPGAGSPDYLSVDNANVTLDHYHVMGEILFNEPGFQLTNSKVTTNTGAIYGIHGDTSNSSAIIRDTTVQRLNATATNVSGGFSSVGTSFEAYRCQIVGTADAIQVNLVSGPVIISQCVVRDLAKVSAGQHLDCIQPFQTERTGNRVAVTIEHCYLDAIGSGSTAIVTPNSAITLGQEFANAWEKYDPIVVKNNYLAGGSYHLRFYQNTGNARITGNTFGPIAAFGTHVVENPGGIIEWTNNVDVNGNPVSM